MLHGGEPARHRTVHRLGLRRLRRYFPETPKDIDRLIPSLKPTAALVHLAIPAEATPLEIAREILTATASGNLTPDTASQLISAIGTLCRIEEIDSLRERISGIEKVTANNKQPTTKQNQRA